MHHILFLFLTLFLSGPLSPSPFGDPPKIGDRAPEFELSNLEGNNVRLSERFAKSKIVLVVLRGYPGYQCPLCNTQAHDFLKHADKFREAGARVILVYPGPSDKLDAKATEFLADKKLSENFELLLDPDYRLTNLYGLRWDAPKETAYPSTFLIDQKGVVFFAKVSKTHGGRTKAAEILEELAKK